MFERIRIFAAIEEPLKKNLNYSNSGNFESLVGLAHILSFLIPKVRKM